MIQPLEKSPGGLKPDACSKQGKLQDESSSSGLCQSALQVPPGTEIPQLLWSAVPVLNLTAGFPQLAKPCGFSKELNSCVGGLVSISSAESASGGVSPQVQTWMFDGKPSEPGKKPSSSQAVAVGLPGSAGAARRPWWVVGALGSP